MRFFGAVSHHAIQSQNLGLNVGSFGTVSASPGLCLRIGFDSGTDVFGPCCVFWWLRLFLAQYGSGKVN